MKIHSKANNKNYLDNYDRIFSNKGPRKISQEKSAIEIAEFMASNPIEPLVEAPVTKIEKADKPKAKKSK